MGTTLALGAGAWSTVAAQAVKDLAGGPAVNQLNFHPPVTRIAEEQHWLHWFMMGLCAVIFVIVFGVMFYSILKHRKSVGHKSQVLPEPIWVELGWTIVPLLIVIGMALPATKVLVAQKDTTNSDVTIKATGMQWKWGYDYIKGEGEGIGFLSTLENNQRVMSNSGKPEATDNYLLKVDNPLVVPVNKKVRIITTANDVIHAWMVPAFGVKQDAIPGFCARHLVPRREDRRLLRPVRRTLRQGTRLHADPREGGDGRGIHRLGDHAAEGHGRCRR